MVEVEVVVVDLVVDIAVAIVGVGQDGAVAVGGTKMVFAVRIAVALGVVGRYIVVAGMIGCIGEEIFYMDLRVA